MPSERWSEQDLWEAINLLWGWMPVKETKEIQREMPVLAALCAEVHHRIDHAPHEQRMVRASRDWSDRAE